MEKSTILGYSVQQKIGSGSFGEVYRVSKTNQAGTSQRALKFISLPTKQQYNDKLNSMGGDVSKADNYFESALNDVVREIQIISELSDKGVQNIVKYYENEIEEFNNPKRYDIYILMELLTPFSDYLMDNDYTVKDVIKLGKDICTALKGCHENKVIHRDIKEDNIFVDRGGSYRLGDFGISKLLDDRSKAGSMKGTLNYIAPEVYLGVEQYDKTVDIYSLGIVLYKLLNMNRGPFLPDYPAEFNTDDENIAFKKRMDGEVPGLPLYAKNRLGEVIVKAIGHKENRYLSAADFYNNLVEAEALLSQEDKDRVLFRKTIKQNDAPAIKEVKQEREIRIRAPQQTMHAAMDEQQNVPKNNDNVFNPTIIETRNKPVISTGSQNTNITNINQGGINMAPVNRKNKKEEIVWVNYLLPVMVAVVYGLFYAFIGTRVTYRPANIGYSQLLFRSPTQIVNTLTNHSSITTTVAKIWSIKIALWVLNALLIYSLFNLGRYLHNRREDYNPNALKVDKDVYRKALTINENIKNSSLDVNNRAKDAFQRVTDRLKNESDFGYGDNEVITIEEQIDNRLSNISKAVEGLYDSRRAQGSIENIESDSKAILSLLKTRSELKKR